ncbi:MAG: hypothetical protein OXC92_00675 [Flavobacteriaceae bacterium]|nr:hypothetical protein [Flavobacteriaceae bacterium]
MIYKKAFSSVLVALESINGRLKSNKRAQVVNQLLQSFKLTRTLAKPTYPTVETKATIWELIFSSQYPKIGEIDSSVVLAK